ncbi:MAG: head-tail connector protein [Pseudomonadota bacterium]
MATSVISPPLATPISLEELKRHLRIEDDVQDAYLIDLIKAATAYAEAHIRKVLIDRTIRQYVESVDASGDIFLEPFPVSTIINVTGYDAEGFPHVLEAGTLRLDNHDDPAKLCILDNQVAANYANGLEIDMVAGFGDSADAVPRNIARAILLLCAHGYEHRGVEASFALSSSLPPFVNGLLNQTRRVML